MRTKTLLLAAAAMAAGLTSSMAQSSNVYSANVVGYVTAVFKGTGNYTLVANPFDSPTNTVVGLLDSVLPNKSQVLTWNPGTASYVTAQKLSGSWNTNPPIVPGQGFFVKTPTTAGDLTNTFVGNILVSPTGGTNVVAIPAAFYLSGSPVPFQGNLNDGSIGGTNTINLGPLLPNKSQVLTWNEASQSYVTAQKLSGSWNTNTPIIPGQGFFISSKAATNWFQALNIP